MIHPRIVETILVGAFFLCATACKKETPALVEIKWGDSEMERFLKAALESKRQELGFSKFEKSGKVTLQTLPIGGRIVLHIDQPTILRTVFFDPVANGIYKWVGEQEFYLGPNETLNPERVFNEGILIDAKPPSERERSEIQIELSYVGTNKTYRSMAKITPEVVTNILNIWREERKGVRP